MLRVLTVLAALLLGALPAAGQTTPEVPLADAGLEARALALHREIRCLVCQNQSIAESNAELARDLRRLVRERLTAGDSDDEVTAYLVARYGDWVLLKPPFRAATALIWLAPILLLLLGGGLVVLWYRRGRRDAAAPEALAADERARLERLLSDGDAGA